MTTKTKVLQNLLENKYHVLRDFDTKIANSFVHRIGGVNSFVRAYQKINVNNMSNVQGFTDADDLQSFFQENNVVLMRMARSIASREGLPVLIWVIDHIKTKGIKADTVARGLFDPSIKHDNATNDVLEGTRFLVRSVLLEFVKVYKAQVNEMEQTRNIELLLKKPINIDSTYNDHNNKIVLSSKLALAITDLFGGFSNMIDEAREVYQIDSYSGFADVDDMLDMHTFLNNDELMLIVFEEHKDDILSYFETVQQAVTERQSANSIAFIGGQIATGFGAMDKIAESIYDHSTDPDDASFERLMVARNSISAITFFLLRAFNYHLEGEPLDWEWV